MPLAQTKQRHLTCAPPFENAGSCRWQKGEGKTADAQEIQAPGLHTLQELSRTIMEEDMQHWFKSKGRSVPNASEILTKRASAVQKLRTMYRPTMQYHHDYFT